MQIFVIIIGGFLGSLTRYFFGELFEDSSLFPLGTFIINMVGCFGLSWFLTFVSLKKEWNKAYTLFIGTGFIGSFTTFSTFSVETLHLITEGYFVLATLYVTGSICFGLLAAYTGFKSASIKRSKKGEPA